MNKKTYTIGLLIATGLTGLWGCGEVKKASAPKDPLNLEEGQRPRSFDITGKQFSTSNTFFLWKQDAAGNVIEGQVGKASLFAGMVNKADLDAEKTAKGISELRAKAPFIDDDKVMEFEGAVYMSGLEAVYEEARSQREQMRKVKGQIAKLGSNSPATKDAEPRVEAIAKNALKDVYKELTQKNMELRAEKRKMEPDQNKIESLQKEVDKMASSRSKIESELLESSEAQSHRDLTELYRLKLQQIAIDYEGQERKAELEAIEGALKKSEILNDVNADKKAAFTTLMDLKIKEVKIRDAGQIAVAELRATVEFYEKSPDEIIFTANPDPNAEGPLVQIKKWNLNPSSGDPEKAKDFSTEKGTITNVKYKRFGGQLSFDVIAKEEGEYYSFKVSRSRYLDEIRDGRIYYSGTIEKFALNSASSAGDPANRKPLRLGEVRINAKAIQK